MDRWVREIIQEGLHKYLWTAKLRLKVGTSLKGLKM